MTVTSRIANYGGVPTLFVNDEPQVGLSYITYFEENNCYRDFAEAGYKLFSLATFFGDGSISESQHIAPFSKGIFEVKGEADYSVFDHDVREILAACPDAMIFPRVNISLPRWWELENPEECNDTGMDAFPETRRACFSSYLWRDQTAEFLRQFIAHVQASDFCDHIVGYQIASGGTEEWFAFDFKGSDGPAARRRFLEQGGDLKDATVYRRFLNEVIGDDIAYMAAVVKKATDRKLIVGSFYGYTMECPWWETGQHGLRRVLNCGDIDFLCSPASYRDTREPGLDWSCITVLDSLKLHGIAYFTELDIRTHLSTFPEEARPHSTLPGTYRQPIWLGPEDPQVTAWILAAVIGRQLTHGTNSWWFDMWGGWYRSPEMMAEMKRLREIAEKALHDPHRESIAEVAVFTDETACFAVPEGQLNMDITYQNRNPLGLAGAPYDIYEICDFKAAVARYKAVVFLVPYETAEVDEAIRFCQAGGIPYLVADPEHPRLTTAQLREFYGQNGVYLWCDTDDVVYVNHDFVIIHASTAGRKTVRLQRECAIQPLMPEGETSRSDLIQDDFQQFETRIYRLGDGV